VLAKFANIRQFSDDFSPEKNPNNSYFQGRPKHPGAAHSEIQPVFSVHN
jgi:hypothetical protein